MSNDEDVIKRTGDHDEYFAKRIRRNGRYTCEKDENSVRQVFNMPFIVSRTRKGNLHVSAKLDIEKGEEIQNNEERN